MAARHLPHRSGLSLVRGSLLPGSIALSSARGSWQYLVEAIRGCVRARGWRSGWLWLVQARSTRATAWYDWYKITLTGGTPSITLSGASADFSLDVSLDDPSLLFGYAATGSTLTTGSVTIKPTTALPAGDYFLIVVPTFSIIDAYGKGSKPAAYATTPYMLSWTE